MRSARRLLDELRLDWEAGLHRLPFFTQRTAVVLLGILVATLALLGGLTAIVRTPPPERRPAPGGDGQGGTPATTLGCPSSSS